MHLPDVNVWLALAFDSHVHHPAAKSWFDGVPEGEVAVFCRLTQLGFLRLATNPRVFGKDALTLADDWSKYDIFLTDQRVAYAQEPLGVEGQWRTLTQRQSFSPKVWNDAFLAAFALRKSSLGHL